MVKDLKCDAVMEKLKGMANPDAVAGMARFGINPDNNLGISVSILRQLAKYIGKDHGLAIELWSTGIHDARMLACMVDESKMVSEEQMEDWVKDFNSWDVCDTCCGTLFDKTDLAYHKVVEWSHRDEEFVKRAGFALLAWLALHDKKADDERFIEFFPLIKREATDDRNYVKKAVNWALRHIGKRNLTLNKIAINTAQDIHKMDSKSARWIASDAIRELTSKKIQERLEKKEEKKKNNL